MPEGPECRRVTEKLRALLKGRPMLWLEFSSKDGTNKYRNALEPLWKQYEPLFPLICLDVICRGKQIFFFMEQGVCLFGGLGMEGHWYRFDLSQGYHNGVEDYLSGKSQAGNPHPHFCLHFGSVVELSSDIILCESKIVLWYDDSRAFGNFTIGTWDQAFAKMTEIGPDWLLKRHPWLDINPQVDQALPTYFHVPVTLTRLVEELRSKRRTHMSICKFLMENKYLSGIGNYLKSEILYRARIHPNRLLFSITTEELTRLYEVAAETIALAYQSGGLTHGTFLDPDMEKGTFQIYVYKREGLLDPNGHLIEYSKEFDGRGTFFVSAIQV